MAVAPGNAGTAAIADQYEVDITSGDEVVALAQRIGADLVVIGPEVPLVLGVADAVRAAGIACFGPTKEAARIEGSKSFAKDVMSAAGVRTANSEIVDNPAHLDAALDRFGPGGGEPAWVVKDDGLAAGKGVVVTADRDAARVARGQPAGLRPPGAARVVPRRARGVAVLRRRRRDGGAAAARSGLQAGRRRRHRPEYRRHGRLRAAAVAARRRGGRDRRRHRETRCRRTGSAGQLVLGAAVRRAGDHVARTRGGRIQLPLRRSRDAGGARAAGQPAGAAAARRGDRSTRRAAAAANGATVRR